MKGMDANMKKQAVLVLIMLILIPRLISCGNDIGSDETSPVTAESSAPESIIAGESSGVPDDLDLNDIEINIWTLDDAYIFASDFGDVCFIPRSLMKDGSVDFASAYAGLEDSAKEKATAFIENFSKATE